MKKILHAIKKMFNEESKHLNKTWVFDAKGDLLSAPLVVDIDEKNKEKIIFGTKEGKVFQIDKDANVEWIYDSRENIPETELMFLDTENINSINDTPSVAYIEKDGEKKVFFGSELGVVYCLNNKGKLLWKVKTDGPIRGTPLIADINNDDTKEIVFGSSDNFIYIVSDEGRVLKKLDVESPIETTPTHVNGLIVVGTRAGDVVAYKIDGTLAWKYHTDDKITARIVVSELLGNGKKTLLAASHDNTLYALTTDGELTWSFRTDGALISSPAVKDINHDERKEIVFGSCDNNIYCIDAFGELIWSYETDFWVTSTPVISDVDNDNVLEIVVGSYDHKLYILDSQGTYKMDYIPGLSGIVNQSGHYSNAINRDAGKHKGKKFCDFDAEGNIVGCQVLPGSGNILSSTKQGKIYSTRLEQN